MESVPPVPSASRRKYSVTKSPAAHPGEESEMVVELILPAEPLVVVCVEVIADNDGSKFAAAALLASANPHTAEPLVCDAEYQKMTRSNVVEVAV